MNNTDDERICIYCKRNLDYDDAAYCPYCGYKLFNYCTNSECEMCPDNIHHEDDWTLKWNYKFCPECGSPSTFHDFIDENDLPQNGQ